MESINREFDEIAQAQAIIVDLLPDPAERRLVLWWLVASVDAAASIAPGAWTVTLFSNGFRLNVGVVETVVFVDDVLRVNLVGSVGVEPFLGPAFVAAGNKSLPQPQCAFVGSVGQFATVHESLQAAHVQFLNLAARARSGAPGRGTPFRGSHCEGLVTYARKALEH
jgi:hypothetical protein